MPYQFNQSSNQNINYGQVAGAIGLSIKTIEMWIYVTSYLSSGFGTLFTVFDGTGTDTDEYCYILNPASSAKKLAFFQHFSTTDGTWTSTNDILVSGTWQHFAITYNGTSIANDPIFYLNGSAVPTTENSTPAGGIRTGTANNNLYVGTPATSPKMIIDGVRYYNRILSATEILNNYNIKKNIPNFNGLVFAPNFLTNGASRDFISGATGTFVGSPVFVANSFLNYGGL